MFGFFMNRLKNRNQQMTSSEREREASLLVGLLFQLGGYQSVVSEEFLAASIEVIHPATL